LTTYLAKVAMIPRSISDTGIRVFRPFLGRRRFAVSSAAMYGLVPQKNWKP
jgi:hypothetical protein